MNKYQQMAFSTHRNCRTHAGMTDGTAHASKASAHQRNAQARLRRFSSLKAREGIES